MYAYMKNTHTILFVVALVFSIGLTAPIVSSAQYNYNTQYGYGVCTTLTSGLYKGLTDVYTGGQVSALQSFLISQGYLALAMPSGYYGTLTTQAVVRYQNTHELAPNGIADLATRNSIQMVSCGYNYNYNNNYYDNYYNNYNYNNNYYNNYGYNNYDQPYLSSISPDSARVGRQVTLYGSDFTSRDNTVHFGVGGERYVSSSNNGTRIRFTIPSYVSACDVTGGGSYCSRYSQRVTPGRYAVYVSNSNGRTRTIYFTVED